MYFVLVFEKQCMCINELLNGQHDEITVSVLNAYAKCFIHDIVFLIFIPIIDLNPCSIMHYILSVSYTIGLAYPLLIIIHLVSLFWYTENRSVCFLEDVVLKSAGLVSL